MTIDRDTIYTPQEVAAYLKCSKTNVYDLMKAGNLPALAVGVGGKGFRVKGEDLLNFVGAKGGKSITPRMNYKLLGL